VSHPVAWIEIDWAGSSVRIEHQWLEPTSVPTERAHAPLMVFLHEGLGSLAMWKDFPQTLCDALGCRGLVYSRPGYGQSTPRAADEIWGSDFMHRQALEVLPALLDALGIDTQKQAIWLFGHSDGASIALLYAAHFPELVQGVVVLAPHINVEDIAVQSITQTREAYLTTDLRQRLSKYHDDPDSAFWGWNRIWLAPTFTTWSIEADLATITCPVLAVQGREDGYGTMQQLDSLKHAVPQAELLKLPACGHSPHRDQPALLIANVSRFFLQHLSGDRP
jgi:pimeloyl-ACP methyl ester carboxylesterase